MLQPHVPVRFPHPSSGEKMVGLTIIDDQTGRTYLDPLVDRTLKLSPEVKRLSTHGTITIEGEYRIRNCHLISGFIVTPLDGQKRTVLPEVVMQNEIPDALNQIPSREEVKVVISCKETRKKSCQLLQHRLRQQIKI